MADALNAKDVLTSKVFIMQIGTGFLFYGIQVALTCIAVALMALIQSRLVMAAVAGLLISSTIETVATVTFYIAQVKLYVPGTGIGQLLVHLSSVILVSSRVNFVISDMIVAWRAWVLWPNNIAVKSALALCVFCSIGGAIANCVLELRAPHLLPAANCSFIYTIPVLCTNLLATIMVGVRISRYRRDVKGLLDQMTKRTRAENILLLLIEVGFIYCLLWVVYIVMKAIDNPGRSKYAFGVFGNTYHSLTGIYATFIILAVAMQRSATESLRETQVTHELRFASQRPTQEVNGAESDYTGTTMTYVGGSSTGSTPMHT
ncbi:hypothetical protein HDZ31DRAFT_63033 [Schizophyllum fasciatum]